MSKCAPVHGGWSAGGTIKNTLGHDATYQITVFFTSAQASDLAYAPTSTTVNAASERHLDRHGDVRRAEHGALRPPGRRRQLTGAPRGAGHFVVVVPFGPVVVVVGAAWVDPPSVQG